MYAFNPHTFECMECEALQEGFIEITEEQFEKFMEAGNIPELSSNGADNFNFIGYASDDDKKADNRSFFLDAKTGLIQGKQIVAIDSLTTNFAYLNQLRTSLNSRYGILLQEGNRPALINVSGDNHIATLGDTLGVGKHWTEIVNFTPNINYTNTFGTPIAICVNGVATCVTQSTLSGCDITLNNSSPNVIEILTAFTPTTSPGSSVSFAFSFILPVGEWFALMGANNTKFGFLSGAWLI